jgi:hypothetical protein
MKPFAARQYRLSDPFRNASVEEGFMVNYDPSVIQTFADRLYAQARSAIATAIFFGVLSGVAGGYATGIQFDRDGAIPGMIAGAVVLGLIGFFIGSARAFSLRLSAQVALCQIRIEANTRGATPTH